MEHYLLFLAGAVFLALLSSYGRRTFELVYFPVFREPLSDVTRRFGFVTAIGFVFIVLYATSAGGVALLFAQRAAWNEKSIEVAALLAAFVFLAARVWTLTQSHSFSQSLYFSAILVAAGFLAVGIVNPNYWTRVTDDIMKLGTDNLGFIAKCFVLAVAATVLSEGLVIVHDGLAQDKANVPYSLVREQIESYETYPRIRGRARIVAHMSRAI